MILVDRDIKQRHQEIFLDNYDEENVKSIAYDVHIDKIIVNEKLEDQYVLHPSEFVFVKTKEKINMPEDLMGRIAEKNSRIRMGLSVTGPHYYPGHTTYVYLRVQNISPADITIKSNDNIAQIIFEQLTGSPEISYDNQSGAAFNDEFIYRGLSVYHDEYEERIHAIKKASEDLDSKINRIYVNILTLMGIFVSIFSLIMVNFSGINSRCMTRDFIIPMNLSLGLVITVFMGLILTFLNKAENKKFLIGYFIVLILLVVGLFVFI